MTCAHFADEGCLFPALGREGSRTAAASTAGRGHLGAVFGTEYDGMRRFGAVRAIGGRRVMTIWPSRRFLPGRRWGNGRSRCGQADISLAVVMAGWSHLVLQQLLQIVWC